MEMWNSIGLDFKLLISYISHMVFVSELVSPPQSETRVPIPIPYLRSQVRDMIQRDFYLGWHGNVRTAKV